MHDTFTYTAINGPLVLLLFIFLFFILPATIMGWIAAGRIRNSEGRLYGLPLAAFAALFVPVLMLVVISTIPALVVVRLAAVTYETDRLTATLVAFVLFATCLIFTIKLSQSLYCRVTKGEPIWKNCRGRFNLITIGLIAALWWGAGILIYVQRPQAIGEEKVVRSPDGELIATGSAWHQYRVFSDDKTHYQFQVRQKEGGLYKNHTFRILPTSVPVKELEEYDFGKNGVIRWSDDSAAVSFLLEDLELYSVELNIP
ncbi:MAG: hypothetical protein ACSHX9_02690 [Luteolibacter sp.]